MSHRPVLATLLTLTQAVILTIAVLTAPAATASAAPQPTISISASKVTLGTTVTVSGRSPFLLQWTYLQVWTDENGWQDVDGRYSALTTGYSFVAPGWYGTHKLRVYAPATLLAPTVVSDTRTLKVKMPYTPKGKRSDWKWISNRGARWDSCPTITYRINPDGGYPHGTADIKAVLGKVGLITGFRFADAGSTSRAVRRTEHGRHPSGTDIMVDWQSPRQDRLLAGEVAGMGGHWVLNGRRFDGWMVLDQSERLDRRAWRGVMMHELGHVVGLGHVQSTHQVMHDGARPATGRWGAGDLAGLRRLGASRGCLS